MAGTRGVSLQICRMFHQFDCEKYEMFIITVEGMRGLSANRIKQNVRGNLGAFNVPLCFSQCLPW